jgi:hypothetical protein
MCWVIIILIPKGGGTGGLGWWNQYGRYSRESWIIDWRQSYYMTVSTGAWKIEEQCNPVWSGSWPKPCHSCSGMFCTHLWARFSQLSPPPWLWWSKDACVWPFTALVGDCTLYKYIRWKCNPVWSGSWPQPCHSSMNCTQLLLRFSSSALK